MQTLPGTIRAFAKTWVRPTDQVVLEATTNTWALVDLLEGQAHRLVVGNPLPTRATACARVRS